MNLNYWLRKTPQPVTVMAMCDGIDRKIDVPKNARAWRDLTETIKSLDPQKITCLDKDGSVIRAHVFESESDDEKPSLTPEMSDVQLFAKLIAEAYDKASGKMQPIVDSAMAFVERGGQRLAKAEAENDRLRNVIGKLHLQIAELSGQAAPPAEESVLGALAAGVIQGMSAQPQAPLQAVPKQGVKK